MEKRYKALLFDLDDTLIDNDESIRYAIFNIYDKLGITCSEENYRKWKNFDDNYWLQWESGKMVLPSWADSLEKRIEYLRANRFIQFLGVDYDTAVDYNEQYIVDLAKNIVPIDGAQEVIKQLHEKYEITISTNGPLDCAREKISAIRITPYIQSIAASGSCGFSKPMPGFFDYAIAMMKNKNKDEMLIIGDSLTTDVLGGIKNGIDSCWYNPKGKENILGINPTYEIKSLKELVKKL